MKRFAYKPTLVTVANVTFSLAPYPTNKHKSIKSLSAHSEVHFVFFSCIFTCLARVEL